LPFSLGALAGTWERPGRQHVRLAYQPPASSTFLSERTSHQQPPSSTFLSEQISTSHQPPAKRTRHEPVRPSSPGAIGMGGDTESDGGKRGLSRRSTDVPPHRPRTGGENETPSLSQVHAAVRGHAINQQPTDGAEIKIKSATAPRPPRRPSRTRPAQRRRRPRCVCMDTDAGRPRPSIRPSPTAAPKSQQHRRDSLFRAPLAVSLSAGVSLSTPAAGPCR
jgi:hypothetical protein